MKFYFTVDAQKQFFALDKHVQQLITKKYKKLNEKDDEHLKFLRIWNLLRID